MGQAVRVVDRVQDLADWNQSGFLNGYLPAWNTGTGKFAGVAPATLNGLLPTQTGNAGKYLTTDGTNSSWATVAVPAGANPTGTIGLAAVNGSASTFLRSDGTPALSQAIAPTWTAVHAHAPAARSSGSAVFWSLRTPADLTLAASTEAVGVQVGGDASLATVTRQFATGTIATQREVVFVAPAYGFVGASTITTAVTVDITGAPVVGTNAAITNSYGLRVAGGTLLIGTTVFRQTGGTAGTNELQVTNDGTIVTLTYPKANGQMVISVPNGGTSRITIGNCVGFVVQAGGGNVFQVQSGLVQLFAQLQFTPGNPISTACDTGIQRTAAGILKINNASSGYGSLICGATTASTIGHTVVGASSQVANMAEWQKNDATVYGTMSENGYWTTRKVTAPADTELASSEATYWLDDTNGAGKFMVKAKTANGTVVTGSITLS